MGLAIAGQRVGKLIEPFSLRAERTVRNSMFLLLTQRFRKLAPAASLVAEDGYAEAGLVLLRAIYETYLWARWVLISEDNAVAYWETGKARMAPFYEHVLRPFFEKTAPCDLESIDARVQEQRSRKVHLPRVSEVAKDVSCEEVHKVLYPFLSWQSHGNPLAAGEGLIRAANGAPIPAGPSDLNMQPFSMWARRLGDAFVQLAECWTQTGAISPPLPAA